MRQLARLLFSWRKQPLFRNYLFWSYRFDLFLLLVAAYLILGALALGPYHFSNKSTRIVLDNALVDFRKNGEILRSLLAKAPALTPDETNTLVAIEVFDPRNEEIKRFLTNGFLDVDRLTGRTASTKGKDAQSEKAHDWMVLRAYVLFQLKYSYTRLGAIALTPGAFVLVLLPIALMVFYVWNVFYAREIQLVLRHPRFSILFGQLLALIILPIAIGGFFEVFSSDTANSVMASGILALPPTAAVERDQLRATIEAGYFGYQDLASAMIEISSSSLNAINISKVNIILITLTCWAAAGLWLARHFGGGLLLASSTIAVVVIALIQIVLPDMPDSVAYVIGRGNKLDLHAFSIRVGDPEATYRIAVAFIQSILIFVTGLLVNRHQKYFLCSGYLGALVTWCFLVAITLSTNQVTLISFCKLVLIVVLLTALVEFMLRKSMHTFLYAPR